MGEISPFPPAAELSPASFPGYAISNLDVIIFDN